MVARTWLCCLSPATWMAETSPAMTQGGEPAFGIVANYRVWPSQTRGWSACADHDG